MNQNFTSDVSTCLPETHSKTHSAEQQPFQKFPARSTYINGGDPLELSVRLDESGPLGAEDLFYTRARQFDCSV